MALVLRRLALVFPARPRLPRAAPRGRSHCAACRAQPADLVEVVVTLPQPPLAAGDPARPLARRARRRRSTGSNVRAPASVSYLRTLASAQRTLQARIEQAIPGARARWHYGVVANGMAVVVPRSQLARLKTVAGATVWPSVTYHELLNRTPQLIGAPTVWGPTLATAGQGMKIGIIDDGARPDAHLLRPDGLLVPRRLPEGEHRVHDAEGDRRARVRARDACVEVREHAVRPAELRPRDERRGHRRRRPRHDRDRRRGQGQGLRHRAERVPRQLQGAHRPDRRASGSTATRRRSSPGSRPP